MGDPTNTKHAAKKHVGFLTLEFENIEEQGVYVTRRGEMFRVPGEALAEGRSPILTWECNDGNLVTRITADPYAPISKCRQLAADADINVNF